MICVSVLGPTVEALRAKMHAAAEEADIIELRLDSIGGPVERSDLENLLNDAPRPVIVTCRSPSEGGLFRGSEKQRVRILQEAIHLGATYVDVELASVGAIRREPGTRLIVSVHDLEGTPPDLARIHREILAAGADIAKIATTATTITDNLRIFELLVTATTPTIALCMGERGRISRILGRKFGAILTYACLEPGEEAAPGQVPAADLRTLYRYRTIDQHTEIYGVIGNPVAHSLSPAVHNAAFDERGVNAVYVPFLVEDVVEFVEAFREIGVKGYSVTLPHKERVIEALDEVEPAAERIGAVNTVVREDGRLKGLNADYGAALTCLERALARSATAKASRGGRRRSRSSPLAGRRVAVVGAGGVARTIAFAVADRGAEVGIFNRTPARARRLAADVGDHASAHRLKDLTAADYDILVNATPVGMTPEVDATPVPAEALRPGTLVFDTIYTPIETRLLREARAAGCRTISGLEMFLAQAVRQFQVWTGTRAPVGVMRRVLKERLGA